MSGLDALREEMLKRGLTPIQVNSKAVAVALDILVNAPEEQVFRKQYDDEKVREALRSREESLERAERQLSAKYKEANEEISEKRREEDRKIAEEYEELGRFRDSLNTLETAEGRDRMRMAQYFKASVDIDTKYDNTAFIRGLALILSGAESEKSEE